MILYNTNHIRIQLIIVITIVVRGRRNVFIYVCRSNVKNIGLSSVFDPPNGTRFRYLYIEKIRTYQPSYPDPQVGLIK